MDATESAALQQLGERAEWPVDELPDEIGVDVLRCLDQMQLVEVCSVVLVNQQKQPGDTSPPAQSRRPWFSPIEQPVIDEGWKGIRSTPALGTDPPEPSRVDISEATRDDFGGFFPRRTHRISSLWVPKAPVAFIVRLNERGRAELARQRRAGPSSASGSDSTRQYDEGLDRLIQATKVVAQGAAQSPMALAAPSAGPRVGDDLLRYLANQPNELAAVVELPQGFLDPDLLTVCDADGLVEFGTRNHCWAGAELRVERGWDFGSIIGPGNKPMRTFIAAAMDFDGDNQIRPRVRLTSNGRVRAARLAVEIADRDESDKAANAKTSRGAVKGSTDWRDIQRRLLELYERGDAYTSIAKFAKRLDCANPTVKKAIDDSAKLKGWQKQHLESKRSPRAISITEMVTDNAKQTRDTDPAAQAEGDDVDLVLARLTQEAEPDERARLNELDVDARRTIVELLKNDPDQYDRVLGRRP